MSAVPRVMLLAAAGLGATAALLEVVLVTSTVTAALSLCLGATTRLLFGTWLPGLALVGVVICIVGPAPWSVMAAFLCVAAAAISTERCLAAIARRPPLTPRAK